MEKQFDVYIYDEESGLCQPARFKTGGVSAARQKGENYIRQWNLIGAKITKIEEVEE